MSSPVQGLQVDQDMLLNVSFWTLSGTTNLAIDLLTRTQAGRLQPSRTVLPQANALSIQEFQSPLLAGELIAFMVRSSFSTTFLHCMVTVDLGYTNAGSFLTMARLAQGPLALTSQCTWNAIDGQCPSVGGPFTAPFSPADPAAGSPVIAGPFVGPVRLWAAQAQYTASVAAANRFPHLEVNSSGAILLRRWPTSTTIIATQVAQCCWTNGTSAVASTLQNLTIPMAPVIVFPGQTAEISAQSIQAGDQFANATFCLELLSQPYGG